MAHTPRVGDTITSPTIAGDDLVTGVVTGIYYTDGEGARLTRGPSVTVMTSEGRERPIRLGDYERYTDSLGGA